MTPPADPFVFIVGSGRSGTTLLRAMLDAHPLMAIPDESHFVVPMLHRRHRYERGGRVDAQRFLADLGNHYGFRGWGLPIDRVEEAFRARPPRSTAQALRAAFETYAAAAGKRRIGDKTPIHVLHLERLGAAFAEARFLHVVRDGRDVARSFLDQEFGPSTVAEAAVRWTGWVGRGRVGGRRLGPARYREVRYEDLVADPEGALVEVCGFLGLEFHPAMLRYHEQGAVAGERPYYGNVALPPTPGLRDWRRDLSPRDLRVFEALAGDLLEELGYPRAVDRLGPADRLGARARWVAVQVGRAGARARKAARALVRRRGAPPERVGVE